MAVEESCAEVEVLYAYAAAVEESCAEVEALHAYAAAAEESCVVVEATCVIETALMHAAEVP